MLRMSRRKILSIALLVGVSLTVPALATVPRFTVSDSGGLTVLDGATQLEWEQAGSAASPIGWQAALAHCTDLDFAGHTDWRVPDVLELLSIVDGTKADPPINATFFPGFMPGIYWTSTTQTVAPSSAFVVHLNNGDPLLGRGGVGQLPKTTAARVLCVRSQ